MNILIANVGNIRMNEIKVLVDVLQKKHTITIACMAIDSSYKGQAFSYSGVPVRVNTVVYKEGKAETERVMAYEFYSTPADAVSIMLGEIMEHRPDMVICGINNGIHMGQDIYCSSNIGMAMEAAYFGVPAIAVGIEKRVGGHSEAECAIAAKFIEKNIARIAAMKLPKHTFLNINIPLVENYSDLKGVKATRLSWLTLINQFIEKTDHKGQKYYWASQVERTGDMDDDTGIKAYSEGFVSVTPINYNATSIGELERFQQLKETNKKSERRIQIAKIPIIKKEKTDANVKMGLNTSIHSNTEAGANEQ